MLLYIINYFYKHYSGFSLNSYLRIAGGLTNNAEKKEIWVTYPDGKSRQRKLFLPSPRVLDGSIINVGTKENVEGFDITEYSQNLTSILANLVQVFVLFNAISN